MPGNVVVAETYPAECYAWFSKEPLGSKRHPADRKKFGASLLRWANAQSVAIEDRFRKEIQGGFPHGDDAFDAVVGLFGMLQACIGRREPGGPDDRPGHPILTGFIASTHIRAAPLVSRRN